jgi:hypothetical protein
MNSLMSLIKLQKFQLPFSVISRLSLGLPVLRSTKA